MARDFFDTIEMVSDENDYDAMDIKNARNCSVCTIIICMISSRVAY